MPEMLLGTKLSELFKLKVVQLYVTSPVPGVHSQGEGVIEVQCVTGESNGHAVGSNRRSGKNA